MKKLFLLLLAVICFTIFVGGTSLFAQDIVPGAESAYATLSTNDVSLEEAVKLVDQLRKQVAQLKDGGFKAFSIKMWIGFVFFIIGTALFIVRIVIKITPTKKDDEFLQKKLNPIIAFLVLLFGRLK